MSQLDLPQLHNKQMYPLPIALSVLLIRNKLYNMYQWYLSLYFLLLEL